MIKTYRFRIKDSNTAKTLDQMDREVKFCWNVVNCAARKRWRESRESMHKYNPYYTSIIKGGAAIGSLDYGTLKMILAQYHKDYRQHAKHPRFRGRKHNGWIPFIGRSIRMSKDRVRYRDLKLKLWLSRDLPENGQIKAGCFTRDISGKWFVNLNVEIPDPVLFVQASGEVGVDLGFKTTAATSNGDKLDLACLKELEHLIAKEQRAKNSNRVTALNLKVANKRKDLINKFCTGLVKANSLVAVGNVSGFTKGKFSKSRYRNSWSIINKRLRELSLEHGTRYMVVDESFSTQTCSACGEISGPKGLRGLGVRFWTCSCGKELDRDVNAAVNILNRARKLAS